MALSAIAPLHLSSLLGIVRNVTRRHSPERLRPGDGFLTNDPYVGGGSHLPDLTLLSPVFVGGRVVAWVANIAHHSDIGGKVAGSESADCTSIFQEGLRLPPIRLTERGELGVGCSRGRAPQLAHAAPARRRHQGAGGDQCDRGAPACRRRSSASDQVFVTAAIGTLLDHAEARTRAEIARLPDGTYENEDFLDNDGVEDTLVRLHVAVTIAGEEIRFDFTGSDPQTGGARNMPLIATQSGVYYVVKAITDPMLPPNSGFFRAVEVTAPEGSIFNCRPPAAVGDRSATGNILGDLLMGALAHAVPGRVMAGCGPLHGLIFSGVDPRNGEYFVDYETYAGASGALANQDGKDAVRVHVSGSANLPIESVEQEFPLAVERYELIAHSGGAGRFRGGLGTRRDVRILAEEGRLAGRGLRQRVGAPGLYGGGSGAVGRFVLHPGTDREEKLPGSFSERPVEKGTVVRVETPSGAGFGKPLERASQSVQADVTDGKVSAQIAERIYGVVVVDGVLHDDRTRALRSKRGAKDACR